MRIPADMPRPARVRSRRGRTTLIIAGVILFFVATSLKGIAGFYVDYLWFTSLGHSEVWSGVLGAKIALALIFMGAFFVIMWVNLLLADRFAPKFRPAGPEEEMIERFEELVGQRVGLLRIAVSLLFAVIAGAGASSEWKSWVLFTHGGSFGIKDPQFHTDVGFYVFKLPFLSFVTGWLFAALLIVLIVTTVAHYLNGGIRVQTPGPRVTSAVKGHLSVLLGLLALVRASEYVLERYQLTLSTRGTVDGATYTDTHAQLPAIQLLLLISIASCALFIVNIFRRGWVLPMLGVGLWALVALIAGGIYPQFVQRVQVKPTESAKEIPYIERNIAATRAAMGIDAVDSDDFTPQTDKAKVDLKDEADTVRNIRLWDPNEAITEKTFQQEQAIRDFYRINDIDVDRYEVDGELTQVVLGVRDLDASKVPQASWEARHLAYTHGQGAVIAPVGTKAKNDSPDYLVSEVPVASDTRSLDIEQPDVYFGEDLDGYIITGSKRKELDYQDEDKSVFTKYAGEDGVGVGSLFRRLSFGIAFGDPNPVISDFISNSSKIHYIRDVRKRVQHLAPFLDFDADPYAVLHDGRLVYVIDGYTTTDRYPYAQRSDTEQIKNESGLNHRFNYVRNSVKAVVDAYDGTVDFYVMPVDDPIIDAYRKAFPGLFKDYEKMPEDLQQHLRYPEDLFTVQTSMWARYHLSDAQDFYNQNDGWTVSLDPSTTRSQQVTPTSSTNTGVSQVTTPSRRQRIEPYYLLLQLPGSDELQFVITRPFSPYSKGDDKPQLTALMFGETSATETGKLRVLVMPPKRLPDGPTRADSRIASYEPVSTLVSLLGKNGSTVLNGNLLVLPIKDSLLYVRPFYVESDATQIPSLRKVIVVFEGDVSVADTLDLALADLFGNDDVATEQPSSDQGEQPPDSSLTVNQRVAKLLREAADLQAEAEAALRKGQLGTYQQKNEEASNKVGEAIDLLQASAAEGEGSTTTTTPKGGGGSTTTSSSTTTTTQPDSA